jgi:YD repeat-containing protein
MKRNRVTVIACAFFLTLLLLDYSPAQEPGKAYLPRFSSAGQTIFSLPLEASPFTGEASTSVPIKLLPATGNIQEKINLGLRYRSGSGNSWVGRGWDLELGYITKVNKFGANSTKNPYLLVLNGASNELVSIGTNQYRTKMESFMRITFDGAVWQVWEKDGTVYKFEALKKNKWSLTRVTNSHGISLVVKYDRPSSEEVYLKEISYPETAGLSPYCKVVFTSEPRLDKILTYYYGLPLRINLRLKQIQIFAENSLQKKYLISYTSDGISQISLLSAVTEYGRDGKALPSTTFSYRLPLKSGILASEKEWIADTDTFTYETPFETLIGSLPAGMNTAIIDMNGDNLPDLVGCKLKATSPMLKHDWLVQLNTGNGFSTQVNTWLDAEQSYSSFTHTLTFYSHLTLTRNTTLIDMNSDGLPDLVYNKPAGVIPFGYRYEIVSDIMVRYNTGSKFSDTETRLLDHTQAYYIDGTGPTAQFYKLEIGSTATLVDMNGDGMPDLVYHRSRSQVTCGAVSFSVQDWTVRLNTGKGFSAEEKTWLTYDKAYLRYDLSEGGWSISKFERINMLENALLADMNNDGLVDLVYNDFAYTVTIHDPFFLAKASYNWKVRYNDGNKFSDEAVTFYSGAPVYFYPDKEKCKITTTSVRIGENGMLADINNDGLPDLIFNQCLSDSAYTPQIFWVACFNLGNKFADPVSISDPLSYYLNDGRQANVFTYNSYFLDVNKDGIVDFVYPKFTQWSAGNVKFKLIARKNNGLLSTDLLTRQTSSFGGKTDIVYASSADYNNNGSDAKNDLPFIMPVVKSVTKNPGVGSAGSTSYSYEGGWYDLVNKEFRGFRRVRTTDPLGFVTQTLFFQDTPRLGKIETEENSVSKILNSYQSDTTAPYFTPLIKADEYMNTKCKRTAYTYDSYGNIINATYYGDIGVSGDEKLVLTDYSLNPSLWLVGFPSHERIFANINATGSPASITQYIYDNNAGYADSPTKGDLTKIRRYRNTQADYIQFLSGYDIYGNKITDTDANGNMTRIEYDSIYRVFPTLLINAKGHIQKSAYYLPYDNKGLFGQVKSQTDANGNEVILEYDGFGRKTKVIGPDDLYSTYGSESYEYYIGGAGKNYILTRTTEDSGTGNHLIRVDILDGFERVIQTTKESEDERIYSFVTTGYNGRGEAAKASLPYFKDTGLITSYLTPDSSVKWINNTYDAIGRITKIVKPDATMVNTTYSGWTTTVVDENGHAKTLINDAYGRISIVKEKNGAEQYNSSYKYDTLDNFILITDHLSNKFEFAHDSLKRRIKMIDPDLGTWTYDYDNNGNLIRISNGKGDVVNFNYDELNRITGKDYAAGAGVEIVYRYDESNSTNGIGRRTSMQDLSGSARWYYDKEGKISKSEKIVDGQNYKLEWTYDAMDRIRTVVLPNLKQLDFYYNNAGLTERIDGYVLNADYNALGKPTQILFSNPLTTRFSYYENNQRLKSILTSPLQDLTYTYDKTGNIIRIMDAVRSYTKDYAYDDLDRLLSGDGKSYTYNAIGNIINANGANLTYSSSKIHALVNDAKFSYAYDSCGNMISGASRSISYDSENRPVVITKNGTETTFFYDGDGHRVKKVVKKSPYITTTIYVGDLYEKETIQEIP